MARNVYHHRRHHHDHQIESYIATITPAILIVVNLWRFPSGQVLNAT